MEMLLHERGLAVLQELHGQATATQAHYRIIQAADQLSFQALHIPQCQGGPVCSFVQF